MISDVVALVLGIVATLTGGVLVWLSYTYHRQQGLRFWEREKRLPDATRYENLKFLNEQEESKLRELRDQLFDARNTIEEADRKREWLDGVRDEIARLEADRLEVQRVQAELESVQRQLAEHNELKVELDAQIEERKQALADLVLKVNGLKNEVNELTATANKLASVRQDLEAAEKRRSELDLEIQRMRSDAEINKSRALDELDRIQRDHTALSQQLVELRDGIEQRLKTRNELDNQVQARQRELDELNADLSKLKREAAELAELNREAAKVREELRELNASKQATEADQARISRQIDDLKQARSQLEAGKKELEQQVTEQKKQLAEMKRELDKYEQEVREKKMQAKELGIQIPLLEGLAKQLLESNKNLGGGNLTVATDLWLPVFSQSEKKSRWNSETDALATLKGYLKHHGLKFHDRTLNAFHTSLKTTQSSPLVVLAGVSGTGKSELPRRYSEAMGMNFLNIAVQPRWDSPQDLFGFYDYLEQRFRPTELTRALIQMDPYWQEDNRGWQVEKKDELKRSNRSGEMLLVLLDEMNLARVEYYFSEFLSRLETRRGIDNLNDATQRQRAEIVLDVGGRRGGPPMRLFVGPNVIFVGTMNEDETTQALSDKVIDRSNVLRFGSPSSLEPVNSNGKLANAVSRTLLYEDWKNSWLRDESVLKPSSVDFLNRSIATLRDAMDSVNRPFAYRVAKGILEYAANYPAADEHMHEIISDQIEQKILPRLRGVDPTERQGSLAFQKIRGVVRDCKDELLDNHLLRLTQDNYFQWIGLDRSREVTNA